MSDIYFPRKFIRDIEMGVRVPLCFSYRRAKTTGCLIFTGHFLQKSSRISGSCAENDLQLKASYGTSPPCTNSGTILYLSIYSIPELAAFEREKARDREREGESVCVCSREMNRIQNWQPLPSFLNDRSLLQKSHIKETIFCQRDL